MSEHLLRCFRRSVERLYENLHRSTPISLLSMIRTDGSILNVSTPKKQVSKSAETKFASLDQKQPFHVIRKLNRRSNRMYTKGLFMSKNPNVDRSMAAQKQSQMKLWSKNTSALQFFVNKHRFSSIAKMMRQWVLLFPCLYII